MCWFLPRTAEWIQNIRIQRANYTQKVTTQSKETKEKSLNKKASYLQNALLYLLHYAVGDRLVLLRGHGEVIDERFGIEGEILEGRLKVS